MKIAIAGSHGVGKTTFARQLARRLGYRYIPDIVRKEAPKKGLVINEKTPPEVQFYFVATQWLLEAKTPESWIADKSLLDYLVYGEIVVKEKVFRRAIRELVKRNADYDLVFYLPIEFAMKQDGLRSNDEEFRRAVDMRYKRTLKELGIKYIIVSGSPKERVKQAVRYLNRK
jgi:nicotinamide riboside kinase